MIFPLFLTGDLLVRNKFFKKSQLQIIPTNSFIKLLTAEIAPNQSKIEAIIAIFNDKPFGYAPPNFTKTKIVTVLIVKRSPSGG